MVAVKSASSYERGLEESGYQSRARWFVARLWLRRAGRVATVRVRVRVRWAALGQRFVYNGE
jgi:hypothetical protein